MTKKQLKFLKKHTGEVDADCLFGKELKMFKYFVKLGYYRPKKSVQVLTPQASNIYYMTEEGEAALEDTMSTKSEKQKFRHDWLIAIFSSLTGIITGAISGVIASIIYHAITKQ